MRSFKSALLVAVCAFLGGVVSEQFLHPRDSYAVAVIDEATKDIVGTSHRIFDKDGKARITLDTNNNGGAPIQSFYGLNGTLRLQMGTYAGDEVAGSDGGTPLIGLSDTGGKLRLLFRLAQGASQSPIMVMKDSKGKDRIILGNSFSGDSEEPFMVYFDKYGVKHNVFGTY